MFRGLPAIFLVTSLLALAVGLFRLDWMLVLAEAVAVAAVWYPCSKNGLGYPPALLWVCSVFSVLIVAVYCLDLFGALPASSVRGISWYWIARLFCLFAVVFAEGMMISILIDRYTGSELSVRWMLVFTIIYTIAFSAMYLFMLGFNLWYTGQPFGYSDIDAYGWEINVRLMVPSTCAIIDSVIISLIARRLLRNVPKESLLREVH